jgi:predicted DNA-binding transcriptional regulator AlpA
MLELTPSRSGGVQMELQMARREIDELHASRAAKQVAMARVCADTQLATSAVLLLTGWSSPTLYRRCKEGKFPRAISPGRWHGGQVLAHLANAVNGAEAA